MIRLLEGTVRGKDERSIILFTNGVGYQVNVTNELLAEHDEELMLYIHMHVREDEITLYGFPSQKDLTFFELVLTINGIGPRMAMAILNEPIETIQNAIFTGDIRALTKISGVGKKIAERICLELKGKVEPIDLNAATQNSSSPDVSDDVIVTLESLGYKRKHIHNVLSEMDREIIEAEEIIRFFLQRV